MNFSILVFLMGLCLITHFLFRNQENARECPLFFVKPRLLSEAATAKNDEKILLQIQDKDCVAIEVRYHQKCYKNYTSFLYRQKKSTSTEYSLLYAAGFEKFCQDVIDPLMQQKKIMYMTHLYLRFLKIVKEVEGLDASSFRRFRLKERLQKLYPQLVFHTPKIRNQSEIVYTENLCSEDLVDEHMSNNHFDHDDEDDDSHQSDSENEMEWNEENVQNVNSSNQPSFNEVQILYNASMIIRNKIDKPALDLP